MNDAAPRTVVSDAAPRFRLERLLPFACFATAGLLFASEFMTAFEFVPPGLEALGDQSNHDRHAWAPAVLAVFSVIALLAAIAIGSKPASFAVAACGVIALLIFLLLDLPDAGNVGPFNDEGSIGPTAEAVPQSGFWLQLLGALGLAISGAALATLTPTQLKALGPGGGRKPKDRRRERTALPGEAATDANPGGATNSPEADRSRSGRPTAPD